jgi:hypothetical protein
MMTSKKTARMSNCVETDRNEASLINFNGNDNITSSDKIPSGTFHGGDELPPGTFH